MDMLMSMMYKGAKAKGKGKKGGGGGKFEGTCHFCSKYGHRASDCWEKDKAMTESRGKG